MKKIFSPVILSLFFLTIGCGGGSQNPDSIPGVPDEENPIIQAKKQQSGRTEDTSTTVIENTQQEIEESSEKVDEALDKL